MLVLDAGARVTQVRFLPDGRLLVGTWAAGDGELLILPLPSGPRVVIPLSVRQVWDEPNRVAVSPAGDRLYTTFGALRTHDAADGRELPEGPSGPASQVIVSPDGERLVTVYQEQDGSAVTVGRSAAGDVRWLRSDPHPHWLNLAGFAPDGDRYLLVGPQHALLVRRFS
ncbi:MAG TPA: hypothetical protein VD866_15050, partial [Urbifossiella sp.]|nr:hypothetical protein [Urbifossiella sp.]